MLRQNSESKTEEKDAASSLDLGLTVAAPIIDGKKYNMKKQQRYDLDRKQRNLKENNMELAQIQSHIY